MRTETCCFTGHRELPVWGRKELAAKLEDTIIGMIDRGIRILWGWGRPWLGHPRRSNCTQVKGAFSVYQADFGIPLPDTDKRLAYR